MKGKYAISSASAKLSSVVRTNKISPKDGSDTIGFTFTEDQAVDLATMILAVARQRKATGVIHVTAHKRDNTVTVIRRKA